MFLAFPDTNQEKDYILLNVSIIFIIAIQPGLYLSHFI